MQTKDWIQSAFRDNPIGTAVVDVEGNWLGVNRALTRILGYSEEELLQTDFQSITHPDDLEQDYLLMDQLMSRKLDFFEVEKRYRVKAGHYVWILLTGTLVFNDAGEAQYYIAQIQDISAQVALRDQTTKNLGDLSSLMNDASVVIVRFTKEFHYLYVNDAVERAIGLKPSEMIGKRIDEVALPEKFRASITKLLAKTIATDQPQEKILERPSVNGVRHVVIRVQPEHDPHGEIQSLILVSTDITAIKTIELQLRQALVEIRQLQSILPICSYCKNIRDDNDYWSTVENYISKHTDSRFSHSICPDCYAREIVPQLEKLPKPEED